MQQFTNNRETDDAILVGIELDRNDGSWGIDDSLDELGELATTAGLKVVGRTYQKLKECNPKTFIGVGKVEEIKTMLASMDAFTVIFDDELSPVQNRNLEKAFGDGITVIDRTALILDIFAKHAHTKEGQLQVELAQYEYRLPRLTKIWTNLAQQVGGRAGAGVGLRGPGEKQLESDRRVIRKKISMLKDKIEAIKAHRSRHTDLRKKRGMNIAALVGYTNAGKSSLLNTLSSSEVGVENKLFSTLDPTTRRVRLPSGKVILLTDTVGFIKKLPHNLVAAFRATLEGVKEADVIIHVADVSHPMVKVQMKTTEKVLAEEGVSNTPIITAWNKSDLLDPNEKEHLRGFADLILVSAKTGDGCDILLRSIEDAIDKLLIPVEAEIPYKEAALLAEIHESGSIELIKHLETGSYVKAFVPGFLWKKMEPYIHNRVPEKAGKAE
jgi:GTP-binding protein HflX